MKIPKGPQQKTTCCCRYFQKTILHKVSPQYTHSKKETPIFTHHDRPHARKGMHSCSILSSVLFSLTPNERTYEGYSLPALPPYPAEKTNNPKQLFFARRVADRYRSRIVACRPPTQPKEARRNPRLFGDGKRACTSRTDRRIRGTRGLKLNG